MSLWGRQRTLQDTHDVLIEPYKRLTVSDMVAKQLLSRPAETSEVLQSALPMYLIDGQQPLLCAKHWALLAHSPNFSRYSEFLKSRRAGSLHFMPPFELEELMQLRPVVLPGEQELTEAVVRVCTAPGQSQNAQTPAALSHIPQTRVQAVAQ